MGGELYGGSYMRKFLLGTVTSCGGGSFPQYGRIFAGGGIATQYGAMCGVMYVSWY